LGPSWTPLRPQGRWRRLFRRAGLQRPSGPAGAARLPTWRRLSSSSSVSGPRLRRFVTLPWCRRSPHRRPWHQLRWYMCVEAAACRRSRRRIRAPTVSWSAGPRSSDFRWAPGRRTSPWTALNRRDTSRLAPLQRRRLLRRAVAGGGGHVAPRKSANPTRGNPHLPALKKSTGYLQHALAFKPVRVPL